MGVHVDGLTGPVFDWRMRSWRAIYRCWRGTELAACTFSTVGVADMAVTTPGNPRTRLAASA